MRKEFKLTQQRTGKLLLIWLGGVVVGVTLTLKITDLLPSDSKPLKLICCLVIMGGGGYLLYRWGKAVAAVPTLVTITADCLTISKLRTNEETQVPFDQIAAYRASEFNGAEELRLTLRDTSRIKISVNTRLFSDQNFGAMVRAFERAVGNYQLQSGQPEAVVRERTFFEKPVSTLVLVALTAGLLWAAWTATTSPRPVRGSAFSALGSYFIYVAAWMAARERRNEPS